MPIELRNRRTAAFSMIEIIIVLFIMALLTVIAVPMLSSFVKTSKVQQACDLISTVLYRARMDALRTRRYVSVFFGDDLAKLPVQPTPGILPARGCIEAWSVLIASGGSNDNTTGIYCSPYNNQGDWYPYMAKDQKLALDPVVLPDGIRVLAGLFVRTSGSNPPIIDYAWGGAVDDGGNGYKMSPDGEIKRHTITFSRSGAAPGWFDGLNSFQTMLVFDEATGEHALMSITESVLTSKPRVLPFHLHGIYGPSGTYYLINQFADVAKYVDQ
jgi:type II secretory pathway pseudopilin PulG